MDIFGRPDRLGSLDRLTLYARCYRFEPETISLLPLRGFLYQSKSPLLLCLTNLFFFAVGGRCMTRKIRPLAAVFALEADDSENLLAALASEADD